ncbi:MAG TPA: hypothetical protein PKA77_03675 [Chitinophagaceae bacterium]|jgi:hypothetical protein|nr:hypothetical protein [Chitinophagaceae bacterium]HMU57475.1 hypothetical protein [Chitinophagaceae bacterium]
MKALRFLPAIAVLAISFVSCKSKTSDAPPLFCDTVCFKDTLKFTGTHALAPSVFILAKDCAPDTIMWTYKGMGSFRKTTFDFSDIKMNKDYVRCIFKDTGYAYILFNDCLTGRGYQIKLPFDKKASFIMKSSGINNTDRRFSIADNIVAHTDRGNIFIQDMNTGKTAMMTFGKEIELDYDNIHNYIDSVNITNERIWVKVKIDGEWAVKEKKFTWE